MKILITGINGFVGSNLVRFLKSKYDIYGLDIIDPVIEGVLYTYRWEQLNTNNIPDVDVIIHLAGKAHDTLNHTEPQEYFDINSGLTKLIYDYYLQSSASKFIFFSSVKAAAYKLDNDCLTEDVIPNPIGPYGESKLKAEQYIHDNLPVNKENKYVYILRPCMIHGPGNKGNFNLLYNIVSKGIPWPLGSFQNRRTFTSIDNICFIVESLLIQVIDSGVYNVGDDEALSTNELIEIICRVIGKKTHIWKINKRVVKSCATVGGWLHMPLNIERLQKLTENYISSNAKIKAALGIEKMPIDARMGFVRTIESFHHII